MVLELLRQGQVGLVIFCRDDEAGGVPVDAVDDAGAELPVDAGEGLLTVVEQRVDQRAVRVAGGGVTASTAPASSRAFFFTGTPQSITRPSSIQRWAAERVSPSTERVRN